MRDIGVYRKNEINGQTSNVVATNQPLLKNFHKVLPFVTKCQRHRHQILSFGLILSELERIHFDYADSFRGKM